MDSSAQNSNVDTTILSGKVQRLIQQFNLQNEQNVESSSRALSRVHLFDVHQKFTNDDLPRVSDIKKIFEDKADDDDDTDRKCQICKKKAKMCIPKFKEEGNEIPTSDVNMEYVRDLIYEVSEYRGSDSGNEKQGSSSDINLDDSDDLIVEVSENVGDHQLSDFDFEKSYDLFNGDFLSEADINKPYYLFNECCSCNAHIKIPSKLFSEGNSNAIDIGQSNDLFNDVPSKAVVENEESSSDINDDDIDDLVVEVSDKSLSDVDFSDDLISLKDKDSLKYPSDSDLTDSTSESTKSLKQNNNDGGEFGEKMVSRQCVQRIDDLVTETIVEGIKIASVKNSAIIIKEGSNSSRNSSRNTNVRDERKLRTDVKRPGNVTEQRVAPMRSRNVQKTAEENNIAIQNRDNTYLNGFAYFFLGLIFAYTLHSYAFLIKFWWNHH